MTDPGLASVESIRQSLWVFGEVGMGDDWLLKALRFPDKHVHYGLNSLKWGYIGDNLGRNIRAIEGGYCEFRQWLT